MVMRVRQRYRGQKNKGTIQIISEFKTEILMKFKVDETEDLQAGFDTSSVSNLENTFTALLQNN
jgi:hypothetical protein